jgi:hypothetical protein
MSRAPLGTVREGPPLAEWSGFSGGGCVANSVGHGERRQSRWRSDRGTRAAGVSRAPLGTVRGGNLDGGAVGGLGRRVWLRAPLGTVTGGSRDGGAVGVFGRRVCSGVCWGRRKGRQVEIREFGERDCRRCVGPHRVVPELSRGPPRDRAIPGVASHGKGASYAGVRPPARNRVHAAARTSIR